MAQKGGGYNPDNFRKPHDQAKYREGSKSQYPEEKHAAHLVSLKLATEVLNNYRGPGPVPESERTVVKEVINLKQNLRMVNSKTNLSEHNIIDNALIAKAKSRSGEVLTASELYFVDSF